MASAAPTGDGGGDDKPPQSAPVASPDPPADPQRNGESPAPVPPSGDDDMSAMGMAEIPDLTRAESGVKRPLPSRQAPCLACERRKMILRGTDPGPRSDDELSALPSAPASSLSPVSGMGIELPDAGALGTKGSPSATTWCGPCEFRKKILLDRRLRRNIEVAAPLLPFMPIHSLYDEARLAAELVRALRGMKRPLSVEQERGYRRCDVGKKLMRHKWEGLRHKWVGLGRDSVLEMPSFPAAAGGSGQMVKIMDGLRRDSTLEVPSFGTAAGGRERDVLEKMRLSVKTALREDYAKLAPQQEAQKPSSSPAARVDVLHEKLAQMTNVLTNVLHEATVLQVSVKLLRLFCPEVGFSAATSCLNGSDYGLVEESIGNLLNLTGDGMQDTVKTVITKLFSKEILYDLIVACVGRFTKWLGDDTGKLTEEKHEQYQKQLDLMVNLTMVYEDDPENFSKIMNLMCKIGGCGPLPSKVIDDISPGLDPSTMEQLYIEMLEQLHNVD